LEDGIVNVSDPLYLYAVPLIFVYHPLKVYPDFTKLPVFPETVTVSPAFFDGEVGTVPEVALLEL
jgi:hypothetical protein